MSTTDIGKICFATKLTGGMLPSGVHARLVLILHITDSTVIALLVTEESDIAGSADIILGERELSADLKLCVLTDLPVTLSPAQLGNEVATLSPEVLGVILLTYTSGEMPVSGVAETLARGFPIGLFDPRRQRKLEEHLDIKQLSLDAPPS